MQSARTGNCAGLLAVDVVQHATDLLQLFIWAFSTVGAALVAVIVWGGLKILARLEAIESLLASETKSLRDALFALDRRVSIIEERCRMEHHSERRRHDDNVSDPRPIRWTPSD